jgi:hypothetical protein
MLQKENMIPLVLLLSQAHLHQLLLYRLLKLLTVKELLSPLPSSKYNILNQLANIKADATLLDMVVIPEQQKHLKISWKEKIPP